MRKFSLLALLLLLPFCGGCMTVSLDRADRERVDKFLGEIKRFNDNVEAVRTMLVPEQKPAKLARSSNE